MKSRIAIATSLLALACGLALCPADVHGCANAFRAGESVDVADETALIVWDESAKMEHFIRRTSFVGSAYDMGFLVPTPNRPEIALADPDLFAELARMTEPKTELKTVPELSFGCRAPPAGDKHVPEPSTPGGVIVLEQKRLGDLDYKVLAFRADKSLKTEEIADEVMSWLTRNEYVVRPDLTTWLRPYIENTWLITAFKIAGSPEPGQPQPPPRGIGDNQKGIALKSMAVRMSFKTDRPVFPYREPTDQREGGAGKSPRLLRLFVAARYRMAGKLGDGAAAWPGQTVWSNTIADAERATLLGKAKLNLDVAPGRWNLTEFEDRSSPRQGLDELYFHRSADQAVVARPPIVVTQRSTPWWARAVVILVPFALGGGAVLFVRRTKKNRRDIGSKIMAHKPEPMGPKPEEKSQKTDPRRWF